MKSCSTLALAVTTSLSLVPASAQDLRWSGEGDGIDLFDEANWLEYINPDSFVPAAGTVDPNVEINRRISVYLGTPGHGTSLALNQYFTLGPLGWLSIDSGATFSTGNGGIVRDTSIGTDDNDNKALIIDDAGTAVQAAFLSELVAQVRYGGRLTLTSGLTPLLNARVTFDYTAATLHLTNETVEAAISEHLAKITVSGQPGVYGADPAVYEPGDNLQILSDGGTGSIIRPFARGDTDFDGDVDNTDLMVMISNYTGPADNGKTRAEGDFDGDGDVDGSDTQSAIAGFTGPIKPAAAPAAVPEPASLALLALGGLLSLRRRR